MAIILPGTKCPICNELLGRERPIYATSAWLHPDQPLWRFTDAAMHWDCFVDWPDRDEFAQLNFAAQVAHAKESPSPWGIAYVDESVLVTVNPQAGVAGIQLVLRATGVGPRVSGINWERWLTSAVQEADGNHPFAVAALAEIIPTLEATVPTHQALADRVDWDAVRRRNEDRIKEARKESESRFAAAYAKPSRHNKECRRINQRGPSCPYCHATSGIDYIDKGPESKSYFHCGDCARDFGPVEYDTWMDYRLAERTIIDGKWPREE